MGEVAFSRRKLSDERPPVEARIISYMKVYAANSVSDDVWTTARSIAHDIGRNKEVVSDRLRRLEADGVLVSAKDDQCRGPGRSKKYRLAV